MLRPSARRAGIALVIPLVVAMGLWGYALNAGEGVLEAARREAVATIGAEADARAGVMERRFLLFEALHGLARVVATGQLDHIGYDGPAFRAAVSEIRTNLAQRSAQVRAVWVTDATGQILWQSNGNAQVAMSVADRPYYEAIARGGVSAHFGEPIAGRVVAGPVVHFAKAVRDEAGRLVAMTVLAIDPDTLADLPAAIAAGRVSVSALFRADGALLDSTAEAAPRVSPAAFDEVAAKRALDGVAMDAAGGLHRVALRRFGEFGLVVAMYRDEAAIAQRAAVAREELAGDLLRMWARLMVVYGLVVGLGLIWRRTRAERLARAEAERGLHRMTELAESLRDMVILWELDGAGVQRFLYVSPSSTEMLGFEPAALRADPKLVRYHPDDTAQRNARMGRLLRDDLHLEPAQYRMFRSDGSVIWVEVVSNPVARFESERGEKRFIACFRDVTARRAAEAALGEAQRRLESLTAGSPVTLYELRLRLLPEGGVELVDQFITQSAARMSGYTMEELYQPGFLASVTGPSFQEERQAFTRQVLTEGRAVYEYTMRLRNGRDMRVRDSAFVTRREGAEAIVAGFALDVTEEAQLRDQLLEASKLSFLGEMAAGIAHELHQPLAAIELHAETLSLEIPEATPGREKVLARVEKIAGLVERAELVIRRIRAFSRRDTAPAAPFDPLAAIDDALAIIERRVVEGQARVRLCYPEGPVRVLGHEAPFEQVIMNLVANAVDAYGPADGLDGAEREVTVSVTATEGAVEIAVADRAGGIAPEAIRRLFEPFFTTKPQGVGTGLGLSISYRIVRDMGGQIRGANRDGGAVFTVMLPAVPGG